MISASRRNFAMLLPAILFAVCFLIPPIAMGSGPVRKPLTGCVVGGRFFSLHTDPQTNKPVKAYPMRIQENPDLRPYEGQKITVRGFLYPGDRFSLERGSSAVVQGMCGDEDAAAVRKEFIMEYRLAGYKTAKKNNFDEALRLVNWAISMDRNLCGSYIDRAHVYYLKGDFDAARADIASIRRGTCVDPEGLNFLIIEEMGAILEKAGSKPDAVELYRLGLESCQSEMCRDALKKHVARMAEE